MLGQRFHISANEIISSALQCYDKKSISYIFTHSHSQCKKLNSSYTFQQSDFLNLFSISVYFRLCRKNKHDITYDYNYTFDCSLEVCFTLHDVLSGNLKKYST